MKTLRVVVPIAVTAVVTAIAVVMAVWLTGLVPSGDWSELIKGAIILFVVGSTLLIIAWSAYFSYIVREAFMKPAKKD